MTRITANLWRYEAFDEPPDDLCPESVQVEIAAKAGSVELDSATVLVLPVHTFFITGANADFQKDYDYLSWKYAAVLATTQGGFLSVNLSPNVCVACGSASCVYACTTLDLGDGYSVEFGTSTFSSSENQAASIIGHELLHTTGANECEAYTWEMNHVHQTGIYECDVQYLDEMLQHQRDECP